MAYRTGTVTNSRELGSAVYDFLIDIGWSLISTISTGSDWVFRSTGVGENRVVNIRIASGLSDNRSEGDIQHPDASGYTGYLNGFAYQYFEDSGSDPETDGHGELGKTGPIFYSVSTDISDTYYREYNLWKSSDTTPVYRNIVDGGYDQGHNFSAFDGKRYLFQRADNSTGPIQRVDLYDGSLGQIASPSSSAKNDGVYVHTNDGNEYIITLTGSTTTGNKINKYNIRSNSWSYISGETIASGSNIIYGPICPGVKRNSRDNHWIYIFRGESTTEWTRYDVENDSWDSPIAILPPWTVGTNYDYSRHVYVTKEQSGYAYDRLYITRGGGQKGFASVAIDDDGSPTGTWTTHANLLENTYEGGKLFVINGEIYLRHGGTTNLGLYKWTLPVTPTDAGTWELVSSSWFDYVSDEDSALGGIQDHLCTKVRVSEINTNTYWLFGDLDRLTVVVKDANGEFSYMYVGLFESYSEQDVTYLLDDASSGDNTITVDDPDIFDVGKRYLICEVGGSYTDVQSPLTSESRRFGHSQIVTVIGKSGQEIIVTKIKHTFKAGAKIGEDPMPIMASVCSKEHAQTLDNISLVNEDSFSDPPWQTYKLLPAVDLSFANATDDDERSQITFLYSVLLVNDGDSQVGKEARGQLKGVYVCGTAISSEEEVAVGSDTYIAFDISDSSISQRLVMGPTE